MPIISFLYQAGGRLQPAERGGRKECDMVPKALFDDADAFFRSVDHRRSKPTGLDRLRDARTLIRLVGRLDEAERPDDHGIFDRQEAPTSP